MGGVLICVDHREGVASSATRRAISAARELTLRWDKEASDGLCLGKGAQRAAEDALGYGLRRVYHAEHDAFDACQPMALANAVVAAARRADADVIVAASTSAAKDFMPRVAVALDAGQASDIVGVNRDGSLVRTMHAGRMLCDVAIRTRYRVVTVRDAAFPGAARTASAGESVALEVDAPPIATVVSRETTPSERPRLGEADVVVSGGRGLCSAEEFERYVVPLADALGGAVGASMGAVAHGYAPYDAQVGQTGKTVAPRLYVAVGISGAVQHLAGMKDADVVAVINQDPDAPIFGAADYGLVADLREACPALTRTIRRRKHDAERG